MEIPKPIGNRYVIGDIHGCLQTFVALLDKLSLTSNDQLFLLGDYIDRGKHGKEVIDLIMELSAVGLNVFALRGNHEQDLLNYANEEFRFLEWHCKKNNLLGMLQNEKLKPKYVDFLNSLPFFYTTQGFILVHASINYEHKSPLLDIESMLWSRKHSPHPKAPNAPRIVHGHTLCYISDLQYNIAVRNQIINIDTGAYFRKKHKTQNIAKLGFLTAFNLDTWQIVTQENIEN